MSLDRGALQSCRIYQVELSLISNLTKRPFCAFVFPVASSMVSSNSLLRKRFWVQVPSGGPISLRNSAVLEYLSFKQGVMGSNPIGGTILGGLTQLGQEYSAFNREVVGSQSTAATSFSSSISFTKDNFIVGRACML